MLAAGGGSRMGRPKAELVVGGVRLLDRAVAALRGAGCAPVSAVVREGTTCDGGDSQLVVNPAPDRGMRSSLELAVTTLSVHVDGLAVILVDTPGIGVDAVRAVVEAWRPGRIVTGRYGPRRSHPIVMSPQLWRVALAHAGPDEGARPFLRARADLVDEIEVPGDPADLDTPGDLARWSAASR